MRLDDCTDVVGEEEEEEEEVSIVVVMTEDDEDLGVEEGFEVVDFTSEVVTEVVLEIGVVDALALVVGSAVGAVVVPFDALVGLIIFGHRRDTS